MTKNSEHRNNSDPNTVNQQILENVGCARVHLYLDLEVRNPLSLDSNNDIEKNESRQDVDENKNLNYIPMNKGKQDFSESFGEIHHVYLEVNKTPKQREGTVEKQHENNVYSEIDDLPNTSSNDVAVATDIQTVGYVTMNGLPSRESSSFVEPNQTK